MAPSSGGSGDFGSATVTVTIAATAANFVLPSYVTGILLRAPAANAGTTYVNLGKVTATTGDLQVRSGENIQIDFAPTLMLKAQQKAYAGIDPILTADDYVRKLSYIGTAGDTLLIDVFTI